MANNQERAGFVSVDQVKAVYTPGRLPYMLAHRRFLESVVALHDGDARRRSSVLRLAVGSLAACAGADVMRPPLPENVKEMLWDMSSQLDEHELQQGNSGFYDFNTNRFDEDGMDAAELLLEVIIDHGSDRMYQDVLKPRPYSPGEQVR